MQSCVSSTQRLCNVPSMSAMFWCNFKEKNAERIEKVPAAHCPPASSCAIYRRRIQLEHYACHHRKYPIHSDTTKTFGSFINKNNLRQLLDYNIKKTQLITTTNFRFLLDPPSYIKLHQNTRVNSNETESWL